MIRVAIVGGVRTPFVKAGGALAKKSFIDLGAHVVSSLASRLNLMGDAIEEVAFSTVLLDPRAPNFAREIVFKSGLSPRVVGHALSNNCISGLVAINFIAQSIRSGRIKIGFAGGSESMSRPALAWRPAAERAFMQLFQARTLGQKLGALASFRPGFFLPIPPSPKEPSTGLTMGQHCELMAKEFSISREEQDRVAYRSHVNAAKAQQAGYLAAEISPIDGVDKDNIIRADSSMERLAKLPPVFDRSSAGTISAGNASPLTDGASVICLMAEEEARNRGLEILGYLDDTVFSAIAPKDGLLMAPAIALPALLKRANLTLDQIDRFEVHEAFGAQVAANQAAWEKGWSKYEAATPIGKIPEEKMNVNGSSIAIGHPFAATGGRLVLSALNELKRSGGNKAAISICAAGAMAGAVLVSR